MKYNSIKEEIKWYRNVGQESTTERKLTSKHHFAHNLIRSKLYDVLVSTGCNSNFSILEVGCGSGEPLYLIKIFNHVGLNEVKCISASYVWNRFPLFISKFISQHEDKIRFRKPFNLFGWFIIVYARKETTRTII